MLNDQNDDTQKRGYKMFAQLRMTVVCLITLTFSYVVQAETKTEQAKLWEALKSANHFAMIRHALAPGMGDPDEFEIGKRETQRNLSAEGREQARKIGELFRQQGIASADVFSSQWFRCMDTAELMHLGPVEPLTPLNSFFRDFSKEEVSTNALRDWLYEREIDKPLVLVTHQVNITALTGIFPSSGEIVVVAKNPGGRVQVLGTIETD